jgi:hypothetical protein
MKTTYRMILTAALFGGVALAGSEAGAAPMAVAPVALSTPSFVEKTVVVVTRRPAVVRRPVVVRRRPVVVR